jgi:hypothetical protein
MKIIVKAQMDINPKILNIEEKKRIQKDHLLLSQLMDGRLFLKDHFPDLSILEEALIFHL